MKTLLFLVLTMALGAGEPPKVIPRDTSADAKTLSTFEGDAVDHYQFGASSNYAQSLTTVLAADPGIYRVDEDGIPRKLMEESDLRDVVKAMEILMPGEPQVYEAGPGTSGFGASMTQPSYMKGIYASREEVEKGLSDLKWARSILQKLRAKVEGVK